MLPSSLLYTSDPGLVLGFHGCDKSIRDSIVSGKIMLKPSENKYDWLGYGFYFWQNSYDRALDFARNPPGDKKISRPAVLGAILSLGNCLDLTDIKHIRALQTSHQILVRAAQHNGQILPENKNIKGSNDFLLRELDCFVIENLHSLVKALEDYPYDSPEASLSKAPKSTPTPASQRKPISRSASVILTASKAFSFHGKNNNGPEMPSLLFELCNYSFDPGKPPPSCLV